MVLPEDTLFSFISFRCSPREAGGDAARGHGAFLADRRLSGAGLIGRLLRLRHRGGGSTLIELNLDTYCVSTYK